MKIRKLNFMFILNRLLTACSRARDSFIVLCNFNELQHDHTRNLHMIRHV